MRSHLLPQWLLLGGVYMVCTMCSSGVLYSLSLGLYVYVPPTICYQPSGDLLPYHLSLDMECISLDGVCVVA